MKIYTDKTFDLKGDDIAFPELEGDYRFERCVFIGGARAIHGPANMPGNLYLDGCKFEKQSELAVSFFASDEHRKQFSARRCKTVGPDEPDSSGPLFYLHPHLYNWEIDQCRFEGAGVYAVQIRSDSWRPLWDGTMPGRITRCSFGPNSRYIRATKQPIVVSGNDFELTGGGISLLQGGVFSHNRLHVTRTPNNILKATDLTSFGNRWTIDNGWRKKRFIMKLGGKFSVSGDVYDASASPDRLYLFAIDKGGTGTIVGCSAYSGHSKPLILDQFAPDDGRRGFMAGDKFPKNSKVWDR